MSLQLVHRQRVPGRQALLQVQSFCGVADLRTGSLIVGALSAAASLCALCVAEAVAALAAWRSWADGQRWAESARALGLQDGYVSGTLRDAFSTHAFASHPSILVLLHMFGILEAFHFNFSLLLLYGIHKGRASLAQLWARAALCAAGLRLLLVLPLAAQALHAGMLAAGLSALVVVAAAQVPAVYFSVVVHNYHSVMLSEKFLKAYARDWLEVR